MIWSLKTLSATRELRRKTSLKTGTQATVRMITSELSAALNADVSCTTVNLSLKGMKQNQSSQLAKTNKMTWKGK